MWCTAIWIPGTVDLRSWSNFQRSRTDIFTIFFSLMIIQWFLECGGWSKKNAGCVWLSLWELKQRREGKGGVAGFCSDWSNPQHTTRFKPMGGGTMSAACICGSLNWEDVWQKQRAVTSCQKPCLNAIMEVTVKKRQHVNETTNRQRSFYVLSCSECLFLRCCILKDI